MSSVSRDVGAFITGILVIAIIFVLVRPNSKGPALISTVGNAMTGILSAATGAGHFTSSGR